MHGHGLLRPGHPGTWDIGTTSRHLVSGYGLVVSEVFPPPSEVSPPLLVSEVFLPLLVLEVFPPPRSVLEVAQSLAGLELPVLSTLVLVSTRSPCPRPLVHMGCCDYSNNLNGCYIRRSSPMQRPSPITNVCRIASTSRRLLKLLPSSGWEFCCTRSDSAATRRITLENDLSARISSTTCWKASRFRSRSASLLARFVTGSFVGLVIHSRCHEHIPKLQDL